MSFNKARAKRNAEYYLTQGNIQSAIHEYRALVDNDPKDFNTQNMLGDLYVKADNNPEAVSCYERVAEFYNKQGFAKKAIAIYNKIYRIEPDSIEVSSKLANLYRMRGSYAEARKHYEKLADHYETKGKLTDALGMWESIAELDPRNAEIYLKIADSYWRDGRGSEAADAFVKAGSRHADSKDHSSAVSAFSKALEIKPLDREALEGYVRSQLDLGFPEEAVKALLEKIDSDPHDREANTLLLECYYDIGDTASAEAVIVKMVERDPSNYQRFVGLINVYLKENELDSAVRSIAIITEQMLVGGEHEQLLALLEEVLARNPEHISALRLLARYHGWLKDEAELKNALERVAESARINGSEEDERFALSQLAVIAPHDTSFSNRLQELSGEPVATQNGGPDSANKEVPSFESYAVLSDDGDTAQNGFSARENGKSPDEVDSENNGLESASAYENKTHSENEDPLEAEIVGESEVSAIKMRESDAEFDEARKGAHSVNNERETPQIPNETESVSNATPGDALSTSDELHLDEETESIRFYIEQGYCGLADKSLTELESNFGARPELVELRAKLGDSPQATPGDTSPVKTGDTSDPSENSAEENRGPKSVPNSEVDHALDENHLEEPAIENIPETVAVEVEEELSVVGVNDEQAADVSESALGSEKPIPADALIDASDEEQPENSFENFRDELGFEDSEQDVEEDDFENHYQPAVAYQEMGLTEEAIREFQEAVNSVESDDGTKRFLNCCTMLGHCFVEKDMPNLAVVWFKRAFETSDLSSEELKGLHYDLGNAYECHGEFESSLAAFEEIYAIDVDYRDVAERLEKLRESQLVSS